MTVQQNNQSSWATRWPAPAKLNLMLRILGRRSDGYHLLQTVFQFIELCDWLTFHPLDNGRVCLKKQIPGVAEQQELTIRAAGLLKNETGHKGGVCIEIDKNLPMGGGLGGGSSDAATTLVVLNKLWGLDLSMQQLMDLGVSLGADVPVFSFGHSAWAEGVGELLEEILLPEQWFVVVKPDCHVVTKEVFCVEYLTRDSKSITIEKFSSGDVQNDCLGAVEKLYQPVADALKDLSVFGNARLTGTGACVFLQFAQQRDAEAAFNNLKNNWDAYLTKGLNISPLQKQINRI